MGHSRDRGGSRGKRTKGLPVHSEKQIHVKLKKLQKNEPEKRKKKKTVPSDLGKHRQAGGCTGRAYVLIVCLQITLS